MTLDMIDLASLPFDFTLLSPSYAVRGFMGDKTIDAVTMPAGSIRDSDDVSAGHSITRDRLPG
jgi:hypothetical protein